MRAAVLQSPGNPLSIESVEVDRPGPREVLIRTVACGVCHSDLHFIEGTYRTRLPAVMGHEAAGIVEAVGDDVADLSPGDHVAACLSQFCGRCRFCLSGRPYLCVEPGLVRPRSGPPRLTRDGSIVHQFANVGGYAELMLVHENAVAKLPDAMPLDRAALLGCAVTTGIGAVLNTAQMPVGASAVVIGCGGIGLNCIQGARLAGASRIVAVDTAASKLELAMRLGATDVIDARSDDVAQSVQELLPGGADFVFEAIGLKQTIEQAFGLAGRGGTIVAIGMAPEDVAVSIPAAELVMQGKRLVGSLMGSNRFRIDLPVYAELYLQGRLNLDELVSSEVPLDEVNEALRAMSEGSVARSIVRFDH